MSRKLPTTPADWFAEIELAIAAAEETKPYGVSLNAAAKGMNLPGKPEGMNGTMSPVLWAEGKRETVLE